MGFFFGCFEKIFVDRAFNLNFIIVLRSNIFSRGKMLLGYTDAELANMGGYDLVHYDDLAYVASAHQECEYDFIYQLELTGESTQTHKQTDKKF